jgi:hypothetical protein
MKCWGSDSVELFLPVYICDFVSLQVPEEDHVQESFKEGTLVGTWTLRNRWSQYMTTTPVVTQRFRPLVH